MIRKRYWKILSILPLIATISACSLQKGFEALHIYNYFEAKRQFEKHIGKKNQSPAAYGLSKIYFRNDNPFHQLDSAYHFTQLSVTSYDSVSERVQLKWSKKLSYNKDSAKLERKKITENAYQIALSNNTVAQLDSFIINFPWSVRIGAAIKIRDSLAYIITKKKDNSKAYEKYLTKYPHSAWNENAKKQLYLSQYKETVSANNTQSYLTFIKRFPNNPHKFDAYNAIYKIETSGKTKAEFAHFVEKFPNNPNAEIAWKQLYRLSTSNYNKTAIEKFAKNYPNFPFPKLIQEDLQLVKQELLPFYLNNKYGYINLEGKVIIPTKYTYAERFYNGLALVANNDKYGYIDKSGKLIIPFKFDNALHFDKGFAVVELGDKYGLIDVSGNFVLQPIYEDIGPFVDSLAYVQSKNGFQFYNMSGKPEFNKFFDDAFSFQNGLAKVKISDTVGFIDTKGIFAVKAVNCDLRRWSKQTFLKEYRDSSCLLFSLNNKKEQYCFGKIGILSDNRALVENDGKYGYIDALGNIVIPIKYDVFPNYLQFATFQHHHALLYRNGKYGLIDSVGHKVFPTIFTGIGKFGNLISVSKGKGWGYANSKVRLVIDYQYNFADKMIDGNAIVEKDDKYGLIDAKGTPIIQLDFQNIERIGKKLLKVEKNELYGIFSTNGKNIVPLNYQKITIFSDNLIQLTSKDSINYYDTDKDFLIVPHE